MEYYLVGLAALIVIAVGLLLRWHHRRSAPVREAQKLRLLQQSLGIKPGPVADDASRTLANGNQATDNGKDATGSGAKKPGTALMVHPDADGMRVNGPWLTQVTHYVGDPNPLYGTRNSVRDAQARARALHDRCNAARTAKNWQLAQELIDQAFVELDRGLRRDHWFAADLHNQHGCIRYEQGFYTEAREIWELAEVVCHEWPTACKHLLPTVESNLKLVTDMLGF